MDVFAAGDTVESVSNGQEIIVLNTNIGTIAKNNEDKEDSDNIKKDSKEEENTAKQETEDKKEDIKKQEREKTINDINTFLIESYKLKIDKILANLNLSIERVTHNDPIAQAKLLEKIRGDVNTKLQIINSRNISENRKKILFSIFSYIQENLENKISQLVGQK